MYAHLIMNRKRTVDTIWFSFVVVLDRLNRKGRKDRGKQQQEFGAIDNHIVFKLNESKIVMEGVDFVIEVDQKPRSGRLMP